MSLVEVWARSFRNLGQVEVEPSPGVNLLVGPNGAGKTAFLEAVFVLGRGRSFRSGDVRPLVAEGAEAFEVFGRLEAPGGEHRIGIRAGGSERRIRLDGRDERRASRLARALPVAVLVPQSHQILERGPEARRRVLDWGVFHVEPDYFEEIRRFHRTLRQRNWALKHDLRAAAAWEPVLAELGEGVTEKRRRYLERLAEPARDLAERLLGEGVVLELRPGWNSGERCLRAELERTRARDAERGYTGSGPHRADLDIRLGERTAGRFASRGQQKLVIAGIVLGQARVLQGLRPGETVLLVDDFPAELDACHRDRLGEELKDLQCQALVTGTESGELSRFSARVFHVEQGRIRRGA